MSLIARTNGISSLGISSCLQESRRRQVKTEERKKDVLDRVLRHRDAINHIISLGMYGERAVLTSSNQVNLRLTRSFL